MAESQQLASSNASRRKRQYAGQAYDFGGGSNSALGGQHPGGAPNPGPYPLPPGADNGPYGQQGPQTGDHQPAYVSDHVAQPVSGNIPNYGHQPPSVGGYQPPDPGYTPQAPGVSQITQAMGNMGVGGQSQHQSHQPHHQQRLQLNQLYPTDLLNQPFNVSELDLPPPPVILPANVSTVYLRYLWLTDNQIVKRNAICGR